MTGRVLPSGPNVVGRAEWQAARARLAAVEDELLRAREVVATARRGLPAVRIQEPYAFVAGSGAAATLAGLFAGRRQLVVLHVMFGPDATEPCPGCSLVADGVAGLGELAARDTALVAVSRAPAAALARARAARGWAFPWYSCTDAFAREAGFLVGGQERPGVAVFLRAPTEAGEDVLLTYAAHGRSVEQVLSAYAWLDLTPLGRQD